MIGDLSGVRLLVVGGTGGVGSALVRMATEAGAAVISASRRQGQPERAPGAGEVLSLGMDISDPASIRSSFDALGRVWSAIDILVLSAGETRSVPLKDLDGLDEALVDTVFAANAVGPLNVVRAARQFLQAGRNACIVNISSVAARTGMGSNIAYVGAKAAMDAMSISLAKALAPDVRVIGIAPSALDTPFARGRAPDFIERTIAATPLGRLATVDEVALAALSAARFLTMTTGVVIPVDGGRHL